MTGKQRKLDEEANQYFRVFLESILAYERGQQYSLNDEKVMGRLEALIAEFIGSSPSQIDTFRKELARFYFAREREGKVVRWDSHPMVRDAMLKWMGMTIEQYEVAMGLKHHRTIDDPWEAS